MYVFEIIIALLLAGAGLTALSRHIGTPYPAMVALAGAGLALVPGTPTLVLDPELALTLFVAPVLLDAAFDASPRDLRANWRSVAGLALGAVALTIIVVAVVAKLIVPGMSWPVAVALGAIVAPPDAAAATAVLKQLRPPYRLLVILEGESLFNDASALLVYRLAVGAALAGALSAAGVIPMLLIVTVGSVLLGLVLSRVILAVNMAIRDVATAVVVQFCGTFAVWMLAERLHLSGILTVVVFAMATARRAGMIPARIRIPSYAVWEFAVFVLNVLAFILVGFQLKAILGRIDARTLVEYAGVAVAVCAATIVARIAWVSGAAAFSRWRCRPGPDGTSGRHDRVGLSTRAAAVVGWCGMRGIVTLAAALALPTGGAEGGGAFPFRDLILFTAFSVVLGTLVVQGMTLRPLMNALHLEDDGSVEREVRLARVETLRAALSATAELPAQEMSGMLRRRYEVLLRRAESDLANGEGANGDGTGGAPNAGRSASRRVSDVDAAIVRTATAAERQRLIALRADGTIGDAAFQRIEQELDWEELDLQQLMADDDGESST
jgi:monovalent cation/hydrogen antiporter